MSVVETNRGVRYDGEFKMTDFEAPTTGSDLVARGNRCQLNNAVVSVMLIMVQHCDKLGKETIYIFFSV